MKRILYISIISLGTAYLSSCKNPKAAHPFHGKFVTETGIRFDLRADSTTLIQYDDSSSYEGTWKVYNQGDTLSMPLLSLPVTLIYYLPFN